MATQPSKKTGRKNPLSFWTGMKLWQQIFIALVAGLAVGMIFGPPAGAIKPIGTMFINAIKMLIVPLIFVSLVCGVTSMHDMHKMGRIALKTVVIYLLTTAVAITIGLGLGTIFQPGAGIDLGAAMAIEPKEAPSLIDTFVGLIPKNPIGAMADGNVLQIIVFALLFGIAINLAGEPGQKIKQFFDWLAEVIYKLTAIVISFAPYGVFALMAWVAGTYGLDVLLPLGTVIFAVYAGCVIHAVVVYGGAIAFIAKLNPIRYFQGIAEAQAVAFTTTSSSGTLPVTMGCVQKNLGVSRGVSSFVLPLGATINMDGTALYQGVCALFVAQAYGIDLVFGDYVTIILTSTLASIGTAGVPGAGLIMLSLVLTSVGLPIEGIAIIAGIDRILDMARTALNVTGDGMVSVLVAKSEGELDETIFSKAHVLEPEKIPAE
jgi:Na+/H+-dicarboxylate symporter